MRPRINTWQHLKTEILHFKPFRPLKWKNKFLFTPGRSFSVFLDWRFVSMYCKLIFDSHYLWYCVSWPSLDSSNNPNNSLFLNDVHRSTRWCTKSCVRSEYDDKSGRRRIWSHNLQWWRFEEGWMRWRIVCLKTTSMNSLSVCNWYVEVVFVGWIYRWGIHSLWSLHQGISSSKLEIC